MPMAFCFSNWGDAKENTSWLPDVMEEIRELAWMLAPQEAPGHEDSGPHLSFRWKLGFGY